MHKLETEFYSNCICFPVKANSKLLSRYIQYNTYFHSTNTFSTTYTLPCCSQFLFSNRNAFYSPIDSSQGMYYKNMQLHAPVLLLFCFSQSLLSYCKWNSTLPPDYITVKVIQSACYCQAFHVKTVQEKWKCGKLELIGGCVSFKTETQSSKVVITTC